MPDRKNPSLVGIFVLGAVALLVIALFLFSGGLTLLQSRPQAVAYFEGSVKGLYIGAPVNFRGVKIGSVTNIALEVDVRTLKALIPVTMQFDPGRVQKLGGASVPIEAAIERGLRAQLAIQSIVTGQMMVELDFYPRTPAKFVGTNKHIQEIPTIPSPIQKITEKIENLPVQELANNANRALLDLESLLNSPELQQILSHTATGTERFSQLMTDLQGRVGPLSDELRNTTVAAQNTLAQVNQAVAAASRGLNDTTSQAALTLRTARATLTTAGATLNQAQTTLASLNGLISPNTPERADIDRMLRNLADASRSLKELADELQRNPNSLILGRQQ